MNKKRDIDQILICGTIYSLFLYLLYQKERSWDRTFFFFADNIPDHIYSKFKNKKIFPVKKLLTSSTIYRFIYLTWLNISSSIRWKFINKIPIFGHDHELFSSALIHSHPITVIEDGTANYSEESLINNTPHKKLRSFFYGSLCKYSKFGNNPLTKKIILSGIKDIPQEIKYKVEIINPYQLWLNSSSQFKERILDLFELNYFKINTQTNNKILLLTQPMYEIGNRDPQILIKAYKDALSGYQESDIVIKPHPRDTIDYSGVFPNAIILPQYFPMELLIYIGMKISKVYTINSTAIYAFNSDITKIYIANPFE